MNSRFWVVGGEYTDTNFNQVVRVSERILGRYSDRNLALIAWKKVAEEPRGNCYAHYTVAEEPGLHVC